MQNGELGRAEDGKTGTMSAAGIFRGTVERIAANGAFVRVRQLNVDHVFGPCATVEFPVATPLAVGNKVIVALLEGDPNRPVVIGRLATP